MLEIAATVLAYFANDPMKVFYVLGGSGGVFYWYEKWASKIKIKAKLIKQIYSPVDMSATFEFNAINLGEKVTSLSDELLIIFYDNYGTKHTQKIPVIGNDLLLPPHTTKSFIVKGPVSPTLYFSGTRKFIFRPNKGKASKIYTTSIPLESQTSSITWFVYKTKLKIIAKAKSILSKIPHNN